MAGVDQFAAECFRRKLTMVLGMRSFAEYQMGNTKLTLGNGFKTADFTDMWVELAARYGRYPNVIFDLMNEPKGGTVITTETWRQAANNAIWGIRCAGYDREILVCGNGYSGAVNWDKGAWYGTSNAIEMLKIADPLNKVLFNIHVYLDADAGGNHTGEIIGTTSVGVDVMAPVTAWARANGKKLYMGQIGVPKTANSKTALTLLMEHLKANRDVHQGWSWWCAGPWKQSPVFDLEPASYSAPIDDVRTSWLVPYV
jgi:endoglucanase